MYTAQVMLDSIESVKKFVTLTNSCDFDVNLTNEKYKIDAKSIMGVFSLDLSKPVTVQVEADHAEDFMDKLKEFAPVPVKE